MDAVDHAIGRRRAWQVAVVVALACLALVVGLGLLAGRGDATPEVPRRDDGLAVSTWEPEGLGLTGDNPTLTGTLEGRDGCLVIRANEENSGEIYVPVFDLGASNLNSALLAVGTTVELKGAWVPPDTELSVPDACAGQGRLWRVARA